MKQAKMSRRWAAGLLASAMLALTFSGCAAQTAASAGQSSSAPEPAQERTADIAVLYTGDVHCAVDDNIGYDGLAAYKNSLAQDGCEVVLVDSGDALQGAVFGSYTEGEDIIQVMNALGYDAMTLGNHEFDYGGPARLDELAQIAQFPFLSVNLTSTETGERVYPASVMVERDGVQIAFVGVTTPTTITSSTPTYFMDENNELIYDFMADGTGEALWTATQAAVDEARAQGADYVFALTHLGISSAEELYTSNDLIANTNGIDAVLDGHSHSVVECERVKNKDGDRVLLTATGTKLVNIGMLLIDKNGNISTGLVSDVEDKDPEITDLIAELRAGYEEEMNTVIAHTETELVTVDPVTGERLVRNAETNLGDFCADAYRSAGDADIAILNGGGIRESLPAGDITYGDLLTVNPFGNLLCKVQVKGQCILDALELGVTSWPEENGGFLQVSGLTYELRTDIPTSVQMDENEMFLSVDGERRVQNVMVGDEPLDPEADYTLVSHSYILKNFGNGYTMFSDAEMLMDEFILDVDALAEYINGDYAENEARYADPYGEGRIVAASAG